MERKFIADAPVILFVADCAVCWTDPMGRFGTIVVAVADVGDLPRQTAPFGAGTTGTCVTMGISAGVSNWPEAKRR
jgi:hypothetical protein